MIKFPAFEWVCIVAGVVAAASYARAESFATGDANSPRIVNIYNFIRNSDYRLSNSQDVLYEATSRQMEMLKEAGLPTTWAVQYDALINPRYQRLLKEEIGKGDEIGGWWELPETLVRRAGIVWRGKHEWDSQANVGFSPGYTPVERKKLVDVYMAEFRRVFGVYPKSVGSWYIDEVTLAYMAEKYGVIASCNCKDQIGTDGYTLWGGYWCGAYYPSRVNAYMPAQTRAGQIDVPIFRMLGSDPIYQYGAAERITTLEPVYPWAGGSEQWVKWFFDQMVHEPCLAYAYAQAGQENSFGWDAMRKGYALQVETLAKRRRAGEIRVETLAQSGEWFRRNFEVTPATAVVATEDWKNEGRKSVWYDSRFYRVNFLWEGDTFFIRDLQRFDERVASPTHDVAMKTTALAYEALPVIDGARWSSKEVRAGGWPVIVGGNVKETPMLADGDLEIIQNDGNTLSIAQKLRGGGEINITCDERQVRCEAMDEVGKPLKWGWELRGNQAMKDVIHNTAPDSLEYESGGTMYTIRAIQGTIQPGDGVIRFMSSDNGTLALDLAGN